MNRLDFFALLMAQPFRPFRMRLSLNITVEILHPEMAMLELSTVRVEAPSLPDAPSDDVLIVSLSHIITIERLPAP